MFTCSTLLLFPYPVPADIHGSVQHVALYNVPVDVLPRLLMWFSQAKHLQCHDIRPPQEVQCVHMYSTCGLGCTSHLYQSLFDRNCVGGGRGCGGRCGVAVENCILNCEPLETLCRCVGMCVRCLQVDLPSFEHTHMHAIGKGIRHLRLLCFCLTFNNVTVSFTPHLYPAVPCLTYCML